MSELTTPESSLVRNPIDAFVLAKLREQGLSFSPEAPAAPTVPVPIQPWRRLEKVAVPVVSVPPLAKVRVVAVRSFQEKAPATARTLARHSASRAWEELLRRRNIAFSKAPGQPFYSRPEGAPGLRRMRG